MNANARPVRADAPPASSSLNGFWQGRSGRERVLISLALALLLVAAVGWGALRPALRIASAAPAQLAQLDGQLIRMKAQADEAMRLRQQATPTRQQAQASLEAGVRQKLGAGVGVQLQNDRATINLKAVAADSLSPWLAQVRPTTGAVIEQIDLRRGADGWDGTIVLLLPSGN